MKLLGDETPTVHISSPSTVTIAGAVHGVINFLVYAAGIISVVFVLIGAFQYVTSGGNPENTKKAKDTILYALIGLVVTAVAFTTVQFIASKLQ